MLNISTSQNLTTTCQESQTQQLPLLLSRQRINLQSHQLVWLGELAANISLETLRKIIDYTERFTNIEECHRNILKLDRILAHFWSVQMNLHKF